MKFVIEVEDFYLEEEQLSTSLKSHIQHQVVQAIWSKIKTQVDDFMDTHLKTHIDKEIKTRVNILMDQFVATGKVKERYNNTPELTVPEWIAKSFADQRQSIHDSIAKLTKNHVDTLQKRYDMLFATQLISKVKEAGFLKDEAAKLLLGDDNPA